MRKNWTASAIGVLTLAAGGLTVAAALPAAAAPSGAGNPAGNGTTAQQMTCNGKDMTILVTSNRGQSGWAVGRIVGGGSLIPVSFEYTLVDLTQTKDVFSEPQLKGGGSANHQQDASVTCTQLEPMGTFQQLMASPDTPPGYQLPNWVHLSDEAGFEITVTAIPKP
jgi:hypothetical protein